MINYEEFLELDNVTLQDCLELYTYKNKHTILNDGRVVGFDKEQEDTK